MFKVKLLRPEAKYPTKAFDGDAGFDVYAPNYPIVITAFARVMTPLGFALALPTGYVGLIQAKSGLAKQHGLTTIGNVIDSTYRGECHAILLNTSKYVISLEPGQKIAQLLILPCYTGSEYEVVYQLEETNRGDGGFGSTGK